MPKYTYACVSCGSHTIRYAPASTISIVCACGATAPRSLPTISGPATIKELVDPYTGVHLPVDNQEILENRKSDHYWSVVVPRLVNEHGPEIALNEGWAYFDEKGKFKVYDKPPHKR